MGDHRTHAQIARELIARQPYWHAFSRACVDVVTSGNYTTLERMLPGVKFASRKVSPDEWELVGTCADGSTLVWRLGA